MEQVACARCGERHDISRMEPNQRRPDALLSVPEDERGTATFESKDACILFAKTPNSILARFTARSRSDRYFLRVLLPFDVEGRDHPISWGVWVEVNKRQYERVIALWHEPDQHREPPFRAVLANNIGDYSPTQGLPGLVYLQSSDSIPKFLLSEGSHQLILEQHGGVTEVRVLEWLDAILHPV